LDPTSCGGGHKRIKVFEAKKRGPRGWGGVSEPYIKDGDRGTARMVLHFCPMWLHWRGADFDSSGGLRLGPSSSKRGKARWREEKRPGPRRASPGPSWALNHT